jgi:hypothetical protein
MNLWPFGSKKNQLEIKFDTDTSGLPHHGNIVVTHREKGLVNASVRYSFVGMEAAPPLSKEIFLHIVEEAERQGYEFHHLRNHNYNKPGHMTLNGSYGRSRPTAKGPADMSAESNTIVNAKIEAFASTQRD